MLHKVQSKLFTADSTHLTFHSSYSITGAIQLTYLYDSQLLPEHAVPHVEMERSFG